MGQADGSAGGAFLMKGSLFHCSQRTLGFTCYMAWVTRDPAMASDRTLCEALASPGDDPEKHMGQTGHPARRSPSWGLANLWVSRVP